MSTPDATSEEGTVVEMAREYEPVARSCAQVRRDVQGFLTVAGVDPRLVADVVLVANELAGNSVDHAATPFRLVLTVTDEFLVVAVTDFSTAPPCLRPHDPGAVRGRGLQIVDHVAATWGCTVRPDGKTVSADLLLDAA